MNWSGWYEECIDLLMTYVPKGAGKESNRITCYLEAIREAGQKGADEGRFAYKELDAMASDVLAWTRRNKKLTQLPEGIDSWIDTVEPGRG